MKSNTCLLTLSLIILAKYSLASWTCRHLAHLGMVTRTGIYFVDPDGLYGDPPIQVICDMETEPVSTIVLHDSMETTEIDHCPTPGCYSQNITYRASLKQILNLMELSESCEQEIRYDCLSAPLSTGDVHYAWWVDRHQRRHFYWHGSNASQHECKCYQFKDCIDPNLSCNCNAGVSQRASDSGVITNVRALPITQLRFGGLQDEPQKANYTLGGLTCRGKSWRKPEVPENVCLYKDWREIYSICREGNRTSNPNYFQRLKSNSPLPKGSYQSGTEDHARIPVIPLPPPRGESEYNIDERVQQAYMRTFRGNPNLASSLNAMYERRAVIPSRQFGISPYPEPLYFTSPLVEDSETHEGQGRHVSYPVFNYDDPSSNPSNDIWNILPSSTYNGRSYNHYYNRPSQSGEDSETHEIRDRLFLYPVYNNDPPRIDSKWNTFPSSAYEGRLYDSYYNRPSQALPRLPTFPRRPVRVQFG